MIGWLQLTDEQRRTSIEEAFVISGITQKAIEKDWWVTLTLKALFQSVYAKHLVFKGGTSLSKCWKLISRFSEDIDIALDPEAFGMKYEEHPSKSYVDRLKRNGCAFTSTKLLEELAGQFAALSIPAGAVTIEADPIPEKFPDTDPQTLHVKYHSLYDPNPYIADEVKIEVSVRSLKTPFTTRPIISILSEVFPNPAYAETAFDVSVVEPRKTFLEKAFLLHEEFGKPDKTRIRSERMSRHFYDLVIIMSSNIADDGLNDHELYDHLIVHRRGYSRVSWVDYQTLDHSTISFLPPPEILESYRQDYEVMLEQMIHDENAPSFDNLMEQLKLLQGRFRLKYDNRSFEEIIEKAAFQIKDMDGVILSTLVVYTSNPMRPQAPDNNNAKYHVVFTKKDNNLVFESIAIQKD